MMHFNRSFRIGALLAVTWAFASGCTSTSTTPDSCVLDTTVACSSGTGTGYSCTGAVTPDSGTLTCGSAVTEANGDSGYCCVGVGTTDTCTVDSAVVCSSGTGTGYSCTGATTPEAGGTLSCGTGVAEASGDTGYCCETATTTTDTCTVDTTVACDGSTGYSCTGTTTPDATDATLDCGAGVTGANGTLAYCCVSLPASSTCIADDSVVGCKGGSYGFSCTSSTETPADADSSLDCSDPTVDNNGNSDYCCISFSSTSSCAPDSSVVGCTGDSYGFSCTSTDTPEDAQSTLNCSDPTPGPNNESLYCCTN